MMEDLISEIVGALAEGSSSLYESSSSVIENVSDLAAEVSESDIYALADGNFYGTGVDFSDLFDSGNDAEDSLLPTIDEGNSQVLYEEQDDSSQVSFGSKYTDAEISKMKSDVDRAQNEVTARKNDVNNWESKVSLNDTKEHRANGDYAHAVSKLNEAKSRYNHAVDELNNAKRRLNNAT